MREIRRHTRVVGTVDSLHICLAINLVTTGGSWWCCDHRDFSSLFSFLHFHQKLKTGALRSFRPYPK